MRSRVFSHLAEAALLSIWIAAPAWAEPQATFPLEVCYEDVLNREALSAEADANLLKTRKVLKAHRLENGAVATADGTLNPDYLVATWIRDSTKAHQGWLEITLGGKFTESEINAAIERLTPQQAQKIFEQEKPFVEYLRKTQDAVSGAPKNVSDPNDPHAPLTVTLGEGRFRTDDGQIIPDPNGAPWPMKWIRPQDDGPGWASAYLARFGEIALKAGHEDYVRTELFDNHLGDIRGVLKRYTEYIAHEGRSHNQLSGDAWEVWLGKHFDTANAQISGLYRAASLADELSSRALEAHRYAEARGDQEAANFYRKTAAELKKVLDTHWDSAMNSFLATLDRSPYHAPERDVMRNALTLVSLVESKGTHLAIPFTDERVLASMQAMEGDMRQIMPQASVDSRTGAVPMTRDLKDGWMGENPKPGEVHVPGKYAWFLVTADWGNLYATLTEEFLREGQISITPVNRKFFQDLMWNSGHQAIPSGKTFRSGEALYSEIIRALAAKADAYLKIVNAAIQPDGTTAEGFDPVTKAPLGPRNLTWNAVEYERLVNQWKRMRDALARHGL